MWRALVAVVVLAACSSADPSALDETPGAAPAVTTSTVASSPDSPTATQSSDGEDVDAAPSSGADDTVEPSTDQVVPEGFDRVRATVTTADGEVCELCLWLAATGDQRSLGLMHVTDLGPADGMAFVYPTARTGNFWMKNTVLPLSIAFFGPTGRFLSAFDMEPCTEDPCPLYRTAPDFLIAIETVQGGLGELGIGPGSVLDVTDLACEP